MSISIPRVNAPIGLTGFNFTPENFARWVNFWAPQLEALDGTGGALDPQITGYGRIAGLDYFSGDATAPNVPSSPALAIELPNAAYLVEGRSITIDEPGGFLTLIGIPANMAGKYGYLSALEIEDSGGEYTVEILPANWFNTLQPALSAAGLVCIGKVTSDTDSVNSIDSTFADVIVPLSALRAQIKTLSGTGQEGGATGEVTRAEFNAVLAALEAQTVLIEALQDRIGATGAEGTADTGPNRYGAIDTARLEVEATIQNPLFSKEIYGSVVVFGVAGNGELLTDGTNARDVHSGNTIIQDGGER